MFAMDHWDLARYALGIALILCNIGVWRGVSLEESLVEWDRESGKRLLNRSLALEALFAAVLFVVDTVGAIDQKAEIEKLESENLRLEAQIQPRRLTPQQQHFLAEIAAKYPADSIRIVSYALDGESAVLCEQIVGALGTHRSNLFDGCMSTSTLGAINIGIHVTGDDANIGKALIAAFNSFDLAATSEPPASTVGMTRGDQSTHGNTQGNVFLRQC